MRPAIPIVAAFLMLSMCLLHAGDTPKPPFVPGEKLKYKLVWNGIPVGYFAVDVQPMTKVNGHSVWHFYLEIKTNAFADKIYKVRHYINSYTAVDVGASVKYQTDQRQGSVKKTVLLEFDWKKSQSHYVLNGTDDKGWMDLPERCVDPLAMFYAIRVKDLHTPDKEVSVWVCDGEKYVNTKVRIVKRETIKIDGKRYKTILIEPMVGDLHGVFSKNKKAKLQIWVSDDDYKIPVKVSSKVLVGKFYAKLLQFENPRDKQAGSQAKGRVGQVSTN